MRYMLTDYQDVAAGEVTKWVRRATRDFQEDRDYAAISLTAPTGAGKTVIATAVIERLLFGDDYTPAGTKATILWITDDPSLNEQTRRKMLMASSELKPAHLVTIDEGFDQETFDSGRVYFLNIQKLGSATSYVKSGADSRRWSLWETIGKSVKSLGGHLVVVIDEAHRGTGTTGRATRPTIVSRIISGQEGANPPAPVVWGISATPERFQKAMESASEPPRGQRPITVPVEDVRLSGLLKDKLNIAFPTETQPSHATLTRHAATNLKNMTERWARYSEAQDEPAVMPVLVVQVQAGIPENEIGEIMAILKETWPELTGQAVGHAFGEHNNLDINGQVVRYIAPEDIQDDQHLRVVFFKEALTTGWDCPRAETMLSFRKAEDATYIAQLIGRMVRTPLARRINTDDVLNNVTMVLPYFDTGAVDLVVDRLTKDDGAPIVIETNSIVCDKNPNLPDKVFDLISSLPTYVVPGRAHRSQVRRLHALAARLEGDNLVAHALNVADTMLIDTIERERTRLTSDGTLGHIIEDLNEIELGSITYAILAQDTETADERLDVTERDIDSVFRSAGRGLRDGLNMTYWQHLTLHSFDDDHPDWIDPFDAKILTAALASQTSVVESVEAAAEELVKRWLKDNSRKIADLPDSARSAYDQIKTQARDSEESGITLAEAITATGNKSAPTFPKHIYTPAKGDFPMAATSWEEHVINTELGRDDTIAWYRNPTGGGAAIRVPYESGEFEKPMYPDFVFIHNIDGELKPSIVDPHNYAFADTGPKWRGLATYATAHGDRYQRIDAVIETPVGEVLRLDLKDPQVLKDLQVAATKDDILAIFKEHGGNYN